MVDDDQDDLFLTGVCFRQADFPVEFVALSSAAKLHEYIKDNGIGAIDILLLDLNMPVTGGLETLEDLQNYPHFDELNVFMFSTSSSETDKTACLEAGAKGYLMKPAGLTQMRSFVEAVAESLDVKELSMAS
jgi:DNA-binding response OmpR family regulator